MAVIKETAVYLYNAALEYYALYFRGFLHGSHGKFVHCYVQFRQLLVQHLVSCDDHEIIGSKMFLIELFLVKTFSHVLAIWLILLTIILLETKS
jgi:hypothetical protein